ncbi:MAG: ROK family protein [Armatimonadota bacterium]
MDKPIYVGADLGGTHFRVGVRRAGELRLLYREAIPASPEWDAEQLLSVMAELLARITVRCREALFPAGVGFGSTGDLDYRAGTCYSMKRFPLLEEAPLRKLLEERFSVPAVVLNDGLCATLAELRAGAGRGASDFAMITLGTGIGGGIVSDGRLLLGRRGRVGKVGHQILDFDGPVHCHCGLPGCWQTLAAKEGVTARARQAAARHPVSELASRFRAGEPELREVFALAAAGDAAAAEVVRETGRFVGIGLANLVKILAPERLIVGGGIAEGNTLLLQAVQETVWEYAIKPYQRVEVVPAELGTEAGTLGATLLPEEGLTTGEPVR